MPRLTLAGFLLLAACAAPESNVHGGTPGQQCRPGSADRFVGQAGTSETGAAILRASNAAVLRWAPPGIMLTMDYREDRVTVWLDATGRITQIKCG